MTSPGAVSEPQDGQCPVAFVNFRSRRSAIGTARPGIESVSAPAGLGRKPQPPLSRSGKHHPVIGTPPRQPRPHLHGGSVPAGEHNPPRPSWRAAAGECPGLGIRLPRFVLSDHGGPGLGSLRAFDDPGRQTLAGGQAPPAPGPPHPPPLDLTPVPAGFEEIHQRRPAVVERQYPPTQLPGPKSLVQPWVPAQRQAIGVDPPLGSWSRRSGGDQMTPVVPLDRVHGGPKKVGLLASQVPAPGPLRLHGPTVPHPNLMPKVRLRPTTCPRINVADFADPSPPKLGISFWW